MCEGRWSISALRVLALMVFWGQVQNYMLRGNLSILIVAMVTPPENGTTTMDWDEFDRGMILSSFSYGYIITQILGGRLTEIYGIKVVYGTSLLLTAFGALLTPVVSKASFWGFFFLRLCMGIFEGVTFPSLIAMTARWVPPGEQSRFISRSVLSATFGLIITYPMSGYLAEEFGWESAYYTSGGITIIWFIFWCIFVFDSPQKHPRISPKEKERILSAIGEHVDQSASMPPVPWMSIVKSIPFLSLMATDITNCFGLYTFLTNGPTYLNYMLNFDIKSNGILSSIPMAARYCGGLLFAQIADFLLSRDYMSKRNVRRLFNSISQWSAAVGMFILAFWGNDATTFVSVQVKPFQDCNDKKPPNPIRSLFLDRNLLLHWCIDCWTYFQLCGFVSEFCWNTFWSDQHRGRRRNGISGAHCHRCNYTGM